VAQRMALALQPVPMLDDPGGGDVERKSIRARNKSAMTAVDQNSIRAGNRGLALLGGIVIGISVDNDILEEIVFLVVIELAGIDRGFGALHGSLQ
jgi:hypothetical protein